MKFSKKFVYLLEKFFPQRFKIAKLTKNPIISKIAEKMLFDKNNLTILPKDNTVEIKINKKISPIESVIVPSKIVEHFINEANTHFIMDFCICRESMNCKNHKIDLGCLFMGDSAKEINKEFGRIVTKEEALDHIKKCQNNGLVHIIGRDKLDEMWLGVKSGLKLLTVCNCCSCCCLWKMLPYLDKNLSSSVKKLPGSKIVVTNDCIGCGKCTENICFINAIFLKNDKAKISEECLICGRCAEICPNNAIKIIIHDDKFIEKTINRVKKSVKIN